MQTDFHLVGDSNAGAIGIAARAAGCNFLGGPTVAGRRADRAFFSVDENGIARYHEDIGARLSLEEAMSNDIPLLSTFGFNTQRIGMELGAYINSQGITFENISASVLDQCLEDYKAGPLAFYREALGRGVRVYATYSPQRFPETYFDTAIKLEALLAAKLQEIGVTMVDVRDETTDAQGRLLPELATEREGDQTHANDRWGKAVLDRFLALSAA